jgi:hypothetical protein
MIKTEFGQKYNQNFDFVLMVKFLTLSCLGTFVVKLETQRHGP